jgi:CheY-like chemotaxis protein
MNAEPESIMVVDDDLVVAQLLTRMLKMAGYAVVTAANGREALEKFQGETAVTLIISDLNMPEMNGHEFIRAVRAAGSDVPIIVLSAANDIPIALEAMNHGANDYVPKDQNLRKALMISVERVLAQRRQDLKNWQFMADIAR